MENSSCVRSDYLVEAASSSKLVDDETAYPVIFIGNHTDSFPLVQAGGEVVHDQAVDPRADQADDHHLERIDGEGCAADHRSGHRHGSSDVEMQVLVDNLRQDVEATGGGVDVEQDSL